MPATIWSIGLNFSISRRLKIFYTTIKTQAIESCKDSFLRPSSKEFRVIFGQILSEAHFLTNEGTVPKTLPSIGFIDISSFPIWVSIIKSRIVRRNRILQVQRLRSRTCYSIWTINSKAISILMASKSIFWLEKTWF